MLLWHVFVLLGLRSQGEGHWLAICLGQRSRCTECFLGRNQDDEEDVRIICAMSRAPRSHLSTLAAYPCAPCTRSRHFSRSHDEEATHMYGIHGWKPLPINEGSRPQVLGWQQRQKYSLSDSLRPRTYSRAQVLPPGHQA